MKIKMGKDYCPVCNYQIDSAEGMDDRKVVPMPGDITMCLKCTSLLIFGQDMALEIAPQVIIDSLPEQVQRDILRLQHTAKEVGKDYWDKKV